AISQARLHRRQHCRFLYSGNAEGDPHCRVEEVEYLDRLGDRQAEFLSRVQEEERAAQW
ncbi:MAG: hypothetical protein LQ337_008805, partial [Flavoplaca oasis]